MELTDEITIDRDLNGAINIAQKALHGEWSASEDFVKSLQNIRIMRMNEPCKNLQGL